MGCSSSISDGTATTYSSKPVPRGRINVRLLMNPADAGDNRRPEQMLQSISHIRDTPTLTLEQACRKLQIKDLSQYIRKAKISSRYPKKGLQQDEHAAINLYTQETPFYQNLNEALRNHDQRTLTVWYNYLKLLFTGLYKLPEYKGTVWRGVAKDFSTTYCENSEYVWWAFSSCTSSVKVLKSPSFLGATGARTLFNIEVLDGRNISEFSDLNEDEILLLPGTLLRVISVLPQPPGLHIIHLKQVQTSHSFFNPSQSSVAIHRPPSSCQSYNHHNQENPDYQYGSVEQHYESSSEEYFPVQKQYESQSTVTNNTLAAFNTQIELAKSINGSSEKAQVLRHLLANKNLTDQMIASVADCARTISNNDEKAVVLQLIAKRSDLSSQQFRVSVKAAETISSNDNKAKTLKAFLIHEKHTVQQLDVVIAVTATITYSSDKASVFSQLIRNRYLDAKHFPPILDGIKEISGNSEKSEILCQVAPKLPKSDAKVRQAYMTAASSITSSQEKAAATIAFTCDSVSSKGISSQDLLSIFQTQIELAKSISGSSERAQVLRHLLANKNLTDQMIANVADCARTISNNDEKAVVLQLIAKRSDLSSQQFRVSVKAAETISSDDNKAKTLKAFLIHEKHTVQQLDVVIAVTATITYSSDKASVFSQLIRNRYLDAKHFPPILDGIKEISGNSEKSEILCQVAPKLPKSDAKVRQAYMAAASSITSSQEKAAATIAFM